MQKDFWKRSCRMHYILFGVGTSMIFSLSIIALLAGLIVSGKIGEGTGGLIVAVAVVPATFLGCELSANAAEKKTLITPLLTSAIFLAVLMMAGMILVEGNVVPNWLNLGAIGAGCAISCVKCLKKPTVKRVHKMRSR